MHGAIGTNDGARAGTRGSRGLVVRVSRYRSVTVHLGPLAVGGDVSSDRAADNDNARGPSALRRRFDALRATPMRAHPTGPANAALSLVENRDIESAAGGYRS